MNAKTQTYTIRTIAWRGNPIMARIAPRQRQDVPALAGVFAGAEAGMGFVPNSMLTMAHMPQLPMAFLLLASTVFGNDLKGLMAAFKDSVPEDPLIDEKLPPVLVQLIAFAVSISGGCRYCQAHTSHSAHRLGESDARLDAILDYRDSDLFSASDRAVLDVAFAAGQVPNEATDAQFEALREWFSDRQIVQIVGVIAMFGFLNRWNDTMATTLESGPAEFARAALGALDWQAGKHA